MSGLRRVSKQSVRLFARRRRKHGGPKRRVWRKIHPGIDERTLEIRAVETTGSHIGDVEPVKHFAHRGKYIRRLCAARGVDAHAIAEAALEASDAAGARAAAQEVAAARS